LQVEKRQIDFPKNTREVKNKMFKPKNVKQEEIEEVIEPIVEEKIEDEVEEVKEESKEVTEEPKEDSDEKPTEEQKVNLTSGEVISIIEFNLQRAVQSLQLLK